MAGVHLTQNNEGRPQKEGAASAGHQQRNREIERNQVQMPEAGRHYDSNDETH